MSLYVTALLMLFGAVALVGGLIFVSWLVVRMFVHDLPKRRPNGDKPL